MARSLILNLPKTLRDKVDAALAMGQSYREVAKIAACSHTVIQDYRRNVFDPARKVAARLLEHKPDCAEISAQVDSSVAVAEATQATLAAEPIRAHMAARIADRQRILSACEAKEDFRGWAAVDRNDISTWELQARLDGLLDSARPASVEVRMVVLPCASQAPAQIQAEDVEFKALPGPEKQG